MSRRMRDERFFLRVAWQISWSGEFHFGNGLDFWGIPPPPRISGMFELAGNREVIYGAQSLAGKILDSKNLTARQSRGRTAFARVILLFW